MKHKNNTKQRTDTDYE